MSIFSHEFSFKHFNLRPKHSRCLTYAAAAIISLEAALLTFYGAEGTWKHGKEPAASNQEVKEGSSDADQEERGVSDVRITKIL